MAHSGALTDITNVHNLDWGKFSILGALAIYAIYRFFITALAIVLPVPCGIYVPTLVVGAALGRFVGEILKLIFDSQAFHFAGVNIVPGGYAVIGK